MCTIFQIPKPGLECRRVVFTNDLTICDNLCFATDGGPFTRGVEEGDVDFRIRFEVVGFARFGIGVEEEIDTATLLETGQGDQHLAEAGVILWHTLAAKAMHLETSKPLLSMRVVIIPNLDDSMKVTRSSTFSLSLGSVLLVALYGSAGLSPVSVLLNDMAVEWVENVQISEGVLVVNLEGREIW